MSSFVSCSLTLRLPLSHCSFDSRPLFLGKALLPPIVSPDAMDNIIVSLYHMRCYLAKMVGVREG